MACKAENMETHKKNGTKVRKVLNNLKSGWVGPDGGWGWVIVVATGLSNASILSFNVCFGILFRERLKQYGITTSQTTTIINVNGAVGSVVGLINGPVFRKYTFRQVGCVAGFVCSIATCALAFMKNFYGVLFLYSILYASSACMLVAVNTLAVIPYFTTKRRIAVGLSWGFCGLVHIITPQITTLLMSIYGSFGTIILFGGIALQSIICATLLQPVQMNAKRSTEYVNRKTVAKEHDEKSTGAVITVSEIILQVQDARNRDKYHDGIETRLCQRFGDQHLHNNDENNELETPLMTCTERDRQRNDVNSGKPKNTMDANEETQFEIADTNGNFDDIENDGNNDYEIVHENDDKMEYLLEKGLTMACQEVEDEKQKRLSWWSHAFRTVVAFFDLDILRDFVCVNIMISVSLVFVTEINFIILTPYILADFGLTDRQIAMAMSIAASVDVLTRFIGSAVSSRIRCGNRTFMMIGVGISALGHAGLAHSKTYNMIVCTAIIGATGKGMGLVMSFLILPDHVSLEKLPAATGLQLTMRGILFLAFGPVIGWLRETSGSYTIPLHVLNIFAYYIIISGLIERRCCSSKRPEQIKKTRV